MYEIKLLGAALAVALAIPGGQAPFVPDPPIQIIERSIGQSTILASATLEELVLQYAHATSTHLTAAPVVRQELAVTEVGLFEDLTVEPGEEGRVIEGLLFDKGFLLFELSAENPRLLSITSRREAPRAPRGRFRRVPAGDMDFLAAHPALMVTVALDLPNTDVRQLTNSLRSLLTDSQFQSAIPVGASNAILLQGSGAEVYDLIVMLQEVDEAFGERISAPFGVVEEPEEDK